jgi:hypothetical protein
MPFTESDPPPVAIPVPMAGAAAQRCTSETTLKQGKEWSQPGADTGLIIDVDITGRWRSFEHLHRGAGTRQCDVSFC